MCIVQALLNKQASNKMTPTRIGQKCLGGTFVGIIRDNTEFNGIIVSPKSTERSDLDYRTTKTLIFNNLSVVNGKRNCEHLTHKRYPAAHYVHQLNINGFSDWYIPSRDEAILMVRNLLPKLAMVTVWAKGNGPEGNGYQRYPLTCNTSVPTLKPVTLRDIPPDNSCRFLS